MASMHAESNVAEGAAAGGWTGVVAAGRGRHRQGQEQPGRVQVGSGQRRYQRPNPHPRPCQHQALKYALLCMEDSRRHGVYSPLEIDPCRNIYSSFSFGCYAAGSEDAANIIKELFVPFRCFCTRKNVSHSISQISIAMNVTEGIYANRCSATMSYSKTPTLPRLS